MTRKNVEEVCERLNQKGYHATHYHAGLREEERVTNQDDFIFDRKKIMVATNALVWGLINPMCHTLSIIICQKI